MRKLIVAGLVAVLAAVTLTAAPSSAASSTFFSKGTGKVTLVHGIPGEAGFPVDISVYQLARGSQVFEDVTFGTVAGPLDLKAGIYWVGIRPANAPRYSKPVLSKWIYVGKGSNQSVVAHLSESGSPRISTFRNDVRATGAGNARVTVRHLAQAPAVDVIVNGSLELISGLTNPNQATAVVPADTYNVRVTDAATNTVTAFQGDLPLAANSTTIVYAVGSLGGGSFTPLVQVLPAS
jgi:hypothetical protein